MPENSIITHSIIILALDLISKVLVRLSCNIELSKGPFPKEYPRYPGLWQRDSLGFELLGGGETLPKPETLRP